MGCGVGGSVGHAITRCESNSNFMQVDATSIFGLGSDGHAVGFGGLVLCHNLPSR